MSYISEWYKYLNSVQASNQRKSMNDMLWERRENWKVDRMIFNRVLLEGRLENVKKKYGERIPSDYIDMLAQYDPSGNNKYLAPQFIAGLFNQAEHNNPYQLPIE